MMMSTTVSRRIWPQTVGSLERHHPPWILRGKSADASERRTGLHPCAFDRSHHVEDLPVRSLSTMSVLSRQPLDMLRGPPGYFAGSFPGAVLGAGAAPGGDEPG